MLVDDAALVREGIARLLTTGGFDVVGQRADAIGLVPAVRELEPDVVVMDVRMPPTYTAEGLRAAVELKAALPHVGVLMLSQHVESRHAVDLLSGSAAGVGYLLKERIARPAELDEAVRRVAAGGTAIDPDVVASVLGTRREPDPLEALTARERDVLALVAEGRSNDAIAARLVVTARTVETHMANILIKLGLSTEPGTHRRVLAVLAYLRVKASDEGPGPKLPGHLRAGSEDTAVRRT
jgi:DNA-binding NarL/FixJ family response regulator